MDDAGRQVYQSGSVGRKELGSWRSVSVWSLLQKFLLIWLYTQSLASQPTRRLDLLFVVTAQRSSPFELHAKTI